MKISAISNVNFKQSTVQPNEKPKEEKQGLSITAKTLIGAGVVAAGTLAVYFITRNSKAAQKTAEKVSENVGAEASKTAEPLQKLNDKIENALKELKSEIQDLSKRTVSKLKNDKTKVVYNSTKDGKELSETLIFDKNNDVTHRIIREFTPETGEEMKIVYKGDKGILAKPEEMEGGRYNSKYFHKQLTRYKLEQQGRNDIFYSQTSTLFDNKGNYQDITRKFKQDKKTLTSLDIKDGTVEYKLNPDTKIQEFDWDKKNELNTKTIGYAYTDDNKLNAYYTRQGKINGEFNPEDKVVLKYLDRKYGIVYDTHNEMIAHEPNLNKKLPKEEPKQPKPAAETQTDTKPANQPKPTAETQADPKPAKQPKTKEFIQGPKLGSDEAKAEIEKLNPKIKEYLDNSFMSDFEDITNRRIVQIKNGWTRVEYRGQNEAGDKFKEIAFFNPDGEFMRQVSRSVVTDTEANKIINTGKITYPDGKIVEHVNEKPLKA